MSPTTAESSATTNDAYARCVGASKRVRWEIDHDVLRGRSLDFTQKFLPESISFIDHLAFLDEPGRLLLSQIQGRTYANMFGLVERFINCKVLELSEHYWTGDQVALEALVRFSDEELKHQELFRRVETMIAEKMAPGYRFLPQPNDVARVVLSKSNWAVLALTLHIELFTQAHYKRSIEPARNLSPVFKDIFFFHWKEESQHARLDELELRRDQQNLTPAQLEAAVADLIDLVAAVYGIIKAQADADVGFFLKIHPQDLTAEQQLEVKDTVLAAYRWQYIDSSLDETRFPEILRELVTADQMNKIAAALAGLGS
ncbi:MAG TPA: hypothetical protein VG936_09240 [Lacunisphaera sp.]|nr:hypothetical protein [Lacunisphaera sp.]